MQDELEQRLISSIQDEGSFAKIVEKGISSDSFIVHEEVFKFYQKYFCKYNSIPSRAVISSTFPGFSYAEEVKEHEVKYLCDEVIKSSVKREVIRLINRASDLLDNDPYGTIDYLVGRLTNVHKEFSQSKSFTDADALKRYQQIIANREKKEKGVSVGIKTGIGFFDDQYIGWQPGNLIGIVGRLGVGKSIIAQFLACQAYLSGKRILYISPEMSIDEVNMRWDTFFGKMKGHTFLNDALKVGEVNLKEYKEWLEEVSVRKDWMTLDSASGKSFNIGNITAYVNEFSPDLLVVDGVALLEDSAEQSWVKIMNISYGLKTIAQNYKIVVVATSQANRSAKDDMPRPDQVSYGDAFMQSCDYAIFLQQDIMKPNIRYATIPKVRTGKPNNQPITIDFNVNEGIIKL